MPSSDPIAAVIIPTYNRWPHVCDAVDSVLAQTWPDAQCIVVDDASTDGTASRLRERYGNRIQLIAKEKNGEKSAARNDGVRAAEDAEFVCMLDSDDVLLPDSLASRSTLFLEDPAFDGVAYGISDRGGGNREARLREFAAHAPTGDVLAAYLENPFVDNNGYLLRRETMLHLGMYREDLTNREDIELLIRLAAKLEFRFCGSYSARIRRVDSSARANHAKILAQGNRMVDWLKADPTVTARLGEELVQLEQNSLRDLATSAYKFGNGRLFRQYLSAFRRLEGRTWKAKWMRRWLLSWFMLNRDRI